MTLRDQNLQPPGALQGGEVLPLCAQLRRVRIFGGAAWTESCRTRRLRLDYILGLLRVFGLWVRVSRTLDSSIQRLHGLFRFGAPGRRSEERRVGKECRSRWSPY